VEFMQVTSAPSGAGPYTYTVTRNLQGTGAQQWYAGDALVDTGQAGSGFIDLYSIRGVKSAQQAGPTIVGNVRNSTTYNDWTENWAIGNLNGVYGYGTNTFGVGLGKYGADYMTIDPGNGIRFFSGTSVQGQLAASVWTLGNVASGQYVRITSSRISLYSTGVEKIALDNAGNAYFTGQVNAASGQIGGWSISSSSISSGSITLNSATPAILVGSATGFASGAGVFIGNDSGTYKFRVGTPGGQVLQWDGTNLTLTGNVNATSGSFTGSITAASGTIGGWSIGSTTLTAGSITLNSATPAILLGGATTFSSGVGIFLGNDGGTYKFRAGSPAGSYVQWDGSTVTVNGTITASAGNIGGWNISSTSLSNGAAVINSSVPSISLGGPTGYLNGTGFWVGNDAGTYKFFVGSPAANKYIAYDGNNLYIKGASGTPFQGEMGLVGGNISDTAPTTRYYSFSSSQILTRVTINMFSGATTCTKGHVYAAVSDATAGTGLWSSPALESNNGVIVFSNLSVAIPAGHVIAIGGSSPGSISCSSPVDGDMTVVLSAPNSNESTIVADLYNNAMYYSFDFPHTLTRITGFVQQSQTCTTYPTIQLYDADSSSVLYSVAVNPPAGLYGPLVLASGLNVQIPASHRIVLKVQPGSGCSYSNINLSDLTATYSQ
jgi:hypothetical protein